MFKSFEDFAVKCMYTGITVVVLSVAAMFVVAAIKIVQTAFSGG